MSVEIIVAYGKNHEIGKDNDLLWKIGDMRADMARFRKHTLGMSVVMGRNTFESMGKPLSDRENIVVSRDKELVIPGVEVAHSLEEALEIAKYENNRVNIIGGSAIYALALELADKIHATEVATSFPSADTYFPKIQPKKWRKVSSEEHEADLDNIYPYSFVEYERA